MVQRVRASGHSLSKRNGYGFGLPPVQQAVLVIFAALPTASSAYVLAARMGGNGPYVAGLVTVSTLLGMLSLPLALTALERLR